MKPIACLFGFHQWTYPSHTLRICSRRQCDAAARHFDPTPENFLKQINYNLDAWTGVSKRDVDLPLAVWSDENGNYISEGHHPFHAFVPAARAFDEGMYGKDNYGDHGWQDITPETLQHVWRTFLGEVTVLPDGRVERGEGRYSKIGSEGSIAIPLTLWIR